MRTPTSGMPTFPVTLCPCCWRWSKGFASVPHFVCISVYPDLRHRCDLNVLVAHSAAQGPLLGPHIVRKRSERLHALARNSFGFCLLPTWRSQPMTWSQSSCGNWQRLHRRRLRKSQLLCTENLICEMSYVGRQNPFSTHHHSSPSASASS